jgi:hypothetical protein
LLVRVKKQLNHSITCQIFFLFFYLKKKHCEMYVQHGMHKNRAAHLISHLYTFYSSLQIIPQVKTIFWDITLLLLFLTAHI